MRREKRDDRYLQKRDDGGYRYVRRIPLQTLTMLRLSQPDHAEFARRSLDTNSIEEARVKRDAMEAADDEFWSRLLQEQPVSSAAYQRALARARSLKLTYLPAEELAASTGTEDLLKRIAAIVGTADRATFDAVYGTAEGEGTTLDEAFRVFETDIRRAALAKKSPHQRRKWRELKMRGINNFKREVGDIVVERIARADAVKFYGFWLDRIVPEDEDAEPTHSASAGNKDMDTMRALTGEYLEHIGREDVPNPFRKLRFSGDDQKTRPPFSTDFIRNTILKPGALAGLNAEARNAVLALINTGARPSEIVNLGRDAIVLDAPIPYVDIRPVTRRDDRRELKNRASPRRLPLVGIALDAMRAQPNGFPSYRDNDNLSATVNKFFAENGLKETEDHTLYCVRHSFEARLKLAGVDEELRRYLMGHKIERPKYGYSDDLTWALGAMTTVAV